MLVLGVFVLAIVSFVFATSLTRPLKKLQLAADQVSRGDMGVNVDVNSKDEIGDLAQSFQRMIVSIRILSEQDEEE